MHLIEKAVSPLLQLEECANTVIGTGYHAGHQYHQVCIDLQLPVGGEDILDGYFGFTLLCDNLRRSVVCRLEIDVAQRQ